MAMGVSLLAVPKTGNAYLSVATSTLIAHWPLDEESGVRYDVVGNNDLTDNNTVGYDASGILGNSAEFIRANSEYLSINDGDTNVKFTDANWSLNYWFRMTNVTLVQGLVTKFIYSSGYKGFGCNKSGAGQYIDCSFGLSGDIDYSASSFALSANTWYMATYVWNSDTLKIYQDGSLVNTYDGANTTLTGSTASLVLGANRWTSLESYLGGDIDEVSYFTEDLTSDDITYLYNSGSGRLYTDFFEPVSTTSTSTATTTLSSADVSELKWVIELYLAIFMFLVFTWLGYRFTKFFL